MSKVDLNKDIKAQLAGAKSETEANEIAAEFLSAIQGEAQSLRLENRTLGEKLSVVEKMHKDVSDTMDGYKETLSDYKKALRNVPDAPHDKDKLDLSGVTRWESTLAPGDNPQNDPVAHSLSKMDVGQYNVVCRSDASLGIDDASTKRLLKRFREVSDVLALQLAKIGNSWPAMVASGAWKTLKGADEFEKLAARIQPAVQLAMSDGVTSTGGFWVPSDAMSSRILDYVETERVLLGYFEEVPMPNPTYTMGVLGSQLYPNKLPENTADAGNTTDATLTPQNWTTKRFQFSAVGYGTAVVATPFWEEDAVVNGGDFIMREGAYSLNRGDERWLVNGQSTAQIDGGAAFATNDIRNCGDGIRYWHAAMVTAGIVAPVNLAPALTGDNSALIFGSQGRYAHKIKDSLWLTSNMGMTWALLLKTKTGERLVQTYEVMGGPGTVATGTLASLWGRPLVVSDEVSEAADASGLEGNGGALTSLFHVYRPAIKIGRRGGVVARMSSDYRFLNHQDVFKFVRRSSFKHGYDVATEPTINAGFSLPRVS
jgi:HK97 family phage major capsid protein